MPEQQSEAPYFHKPPGRIPAGTVTFLFTDIEGSTDLWERFPDEMAADLPRHDTLLRQTIMDHGGYIFKTVGDQFCAAFSHARDALGAAVAAQRALSNETWSGPQIKVRIGIHSGSSEERAGDYFGPVVNRVARLMSIGHGGQTLMSAAVRQLIAGHLPNDVVLQDLGDHRLKDLQQPEHVFQVNINGLPVHFPPLNSLTAIINNLPVQLTEFVGRQKDLQETRRILEHSRLLTIVGPGGIGKSRLSLELAAELASQFTDGVFFVPLAPVASADLVAEAIAENVGLRLASAGSPEKQLLSYLAKKRSLLVLDNMEHIIEAAELVDQIVKAAPQVKIIVTSRQRLQLSGEFVYPVHGLGSLGWDSLASAHETEAVQLFANTARRARPDFALMEDDLDALESILSLIQGSPLGIVLAASWVDILSLPEIATEIGRTFDFLETELRDVPERQRSARAAFDYSWQLLSDNERQVFTNLSLFRGGFTRAAARDVAGASVRGLARLVDKSFISFTPQSGRYDVHELLRQFGEDRLRMEREAYRQVKDSHAHCFALLVDAQKEAIYRGDHSKILADLDNIRTAWRWSVQRRSLEDIRAMMFPLGWFYDLRAYHAECAAMMRLAVDALQMPEPEGLQGIVYGSALANYALELATLAGADQAGPKMLEGLDIMRRLGAKEDLAWPQILSGWALQDPGEIEEAFQESLAIFEELGNQYGITYTQLFIGWNYGNQGRYEEARASIQRGLNISRSLGDPEGQATAQRQLGRLNLHLGHFEAACANFQQERDLWRSLGLPRTTGEAIRNLGYAYLLGGDTTRAEEAFLESLEEFERIADETNPYWSLLGLARVALRKEQAESAQEYLDKAKDILQGRQDSSEQARWWQLAGRLLILQGDLEKAQKALTHALRYSLQADNLEFVRTVLGFAYLFQNQSDMKQAARLLGFAQAQAGLPAELVQWRIEPLRASLATTVGKQELSLLLAEGARLDQQAVVDCFD